MAIQNSFVYLIGFSGTGKFTIAQALQSDFDSILVDNHLILNVVFSLIHPDGVTPLPSRVWEYARKVRGIAFDTIRHISEDGRNFIFTNELCAGDVVDSELFNEVADLANDRGAKLVPVRLMVSSEELCRRVVSPERAKRFKEIDPAAATKKIATKELLDPPGFNSFNLDVTKLSAVDAAQQILTEIHRRNAV